MLVVDAAMTAAGILAGVLAWAAAAKLQAHQATVDGFRAFGVPQPAVTAIAVPLVELAVAVLLIALPAVGGISALVLLGCFTTLLVKRLRAGAEVPCACFGQPTTAALSWTEIVRNGMLALLALASLVAGGSRVPGPRGVLIACGLAIVGVGVLSHLRSSRPPGKPPHQP